MFYFVLLELYKCKWIFLYVSRAEKEAIIDKDTPKDIDLTLPGWGSWGGPGIKVTKRKRKRFVFFNAISELLE